MRRAYGGNPSYGQNGQMRVGRGVVESENEQMEEELREKVYALKSLSIDIGTEVRTQNKILEDMHDDFEKTGGFLQRTMNRVMKLGRGGHNYYILYLFFFAIFVFTVLWLIVKF